VYDRENVLLSIQEEEWNAAVSPPVYSEFFIPNKLFFLVNSIIGRKQGVKHLR
jgi:hypothetical protein